MIQILKDDYGIYDFITVAYEVCIPTIFCKYWSYLVVVHCF